MQRWAGLLVVLAVTALTMFLLRPLPEEPPAPERPVSTASVAPAPLDPWTIQEIRVVDACLDHADRSRTWSREKGALSCGSQSVPAAALAELVRRAVEEPVPLEDFPRAAGLTHRAVKERALDLLAVAYPLRGGRPVVEPDPVLQAADLAGFVLQARRQVGFQSTTELEVQLRMGRLTVTSVRFADPDRWAPLPWTVELEGRTWESFDPGLSALVVAFLDEDSPNRRELTLDDGGHWFWKAEVPSAIEHALRPR